MVLRNCKISIGRIALILMLGLVFFRFSYSQDLESLRNERIKQLEEIEYTEKLLQQTTASKQNELNRLNLLNRKIRSREQLVRNLKGELNYLDRNIRNNEKEVELLTSEIGELKRDYANMIYRAFLTSNSYHRAQYILEARDFNQAYKRMKYMQQYSRFRREQAGIIQEKTSRLQEEVLRLEAAKEEQRKVLTEQQKEVAQLNNEKGSQKKFVDQLSSKEKQLRNELKEKRKVYDKIEEEIKKLLDAAIKGNEGRMVLTPEMKIVSDNFTQNRGRLPWPVERGVITEKFGRHKHPVLNKVIVDNPGVNITTEKAVDVRSVFKGTVKNVFRVPGANTALIIQHGEYFTVYQGLVDVVVKKGDTVEMKQNLGKAFAGPNEKNSQIHFEVYKGTQKMDPEIWLAK